MSVLSLEMKSISDLKGIFFIPAYQRGYRWTTNEVNRLLDDVSEYDVSEYKDKKYCLQPIVVKKLSNGSYELIDGQQRLTTIYIIYKVLKTYLPHIKLNFDIDYEHRERSKEFLQNISVDSENSDNIDYFYMSKAAICISDWLKNQNDSTSKAIDIYKKFSEKIEVIWYEVDNDEDGNTLFQRLNIGKIPLTSSELVKAIFMSDSNNLVSGKRDEIAFQWDEIEKELQNESFWNFLANSQDNYQTRIDLILDLIVNLNPNNNFTEAEKYKTFFYFDEQVNSGINLVDIWQNILHIFLILQDWYKDHDCYHKIGYLVAIETKLSDIVALAKGKTKTEFSVALDNKIKESLQNIHLSQLSYENSYDHKKIKNLLLLFNVESMRQNKDQSVRFPFDKYKNEDWSLEHIHAQQSEALKSRNAWVEWIILQMDSVKTIGDLWVSKGKGDEISERQVTLDSVIKEMEKLKSKADLTEEEFRNIQRKVEPILSDNDSDSDVHSISNLALLNVGDNSALSNSTFDVKRNKIIEMDKNGEYIPYCTKMVFLKYYTESSKNQIHFWGTADRDSYLEAIKNTLKSYLPIDCE